jgi:tetratricopeptide (TPR) repeat protein
LLSLADPEARALLGIVYVKLGRFGEALPLLQQSSTAESKIWLALIFRRQGRVGEAIQLLQEALALEPGDADALSLLGSCLLVAGKPIEAEKAIRSGLAARVDAGGYLNLGMALRMQNRGEDALEAFKSSVIQAPDPNNYLQLFKQYQQLSRWPEAIETLEQALRGFPDSEVLIEALALAYGRVGRISEAEALFVRIAGSVSGANSFAAWLQDQGRFDESVGVLENSLRLQPVQGVPYRLLAEARRGGSVLDQALALSKSSDLDAPTRMHLSYGIGKLLDQENRYEEAIRWIDQANDLAHRIYPVCKTFDPDWVRREPELIAGLYSKSFLERSVDGDGAKPVFIVGMIRSGTTLLDQILSAHAGIRSAGEGIFWNAEADALHARWRVDIPSAKEISLLRDRYLKSVGVEGAEVFTDKMPLNYRNLGPIAITFPEAKILHLKRNPLDTCLSIYFTFFAGGPNFVYNQENIATFYQAYLTYMEHWRSVLPPDQLHEIEYEGLIERPEETIRGVLAFLGLDWDPACLAHEGNLQQVNTPSRWQARQPIYKSSLGRGEIYRPWLKALADL